MSHLKSKKQERVSGSFNFSNASIFLYFVRHHKMFDRHKETMSIICDTYRTHAFIHTSINFLLFENIPLLLRSGLLNMNTHQNTPIEKPYKPY